MFDKLIRFSLLLFAILPIGSLFDLPISALSILKCWLILIVLRILFSQRIDIYRLTFILFIVVIYLSSTLFSEENLNAIFKDFFTVAFFLIVAITFWVNKSDKVNFGYIKKLIHIAVIFDILIYISMFIFKIPPLGIRGVFFEATGILRYSDVFTYSIFFISLFLFLREGGFRWLIYMNLISVLSLDRVFLAVSIFFLLYFVLKNLRVKALIFFIPLFFIDSDSILILLRFDELSLSHIVYDVFGRSIEPAIMGGYQATVKTLLFGEGPGFLFYIPWFEYRGLNSGSVSVDSLFVSNFVKYGVIYLFLLLLFLKFILPGFIFYLVNLLYLFFHNGLYNDSYLLFLSIFLLIKDE